MNSPSATSRLVSAPSTDARGPFDSRAPKLLDLVREQIRVRGYSPRTSEAYVGWIRRFVLFHDKRHPRELGAPEVQAFLTALATEHNVAASTQNQALAAILFLYTRVLDTQLPWMDDIVRAKRPIRLPVVLSRDEVRRVLHALEGTHQLLAFTLYGCGLRLLEGAQLRVKDIDFERKSLVVCDGKGRKDRNRPGTASSAELAWRG